MKFNRSTVWAFILLLVTASLYRAWDGRPFGFAPQVAMAIFGGAVIKDKKLAFILPLLSLFLSDVLYQVLYANGLSEIKGFYAGQLPMYLIFAGLTLFGMLMKRPSPLNVLGFTISGSVLFFLASNFSVWAGGAGFQRPKTFSGLLQCYGDALAFYRDYGLIKGFAGNQMVGDLFFSVLLFGGFFLFKNIISRQLVKTA